MTSTFQYIPDLGNLTDEVVPRVFDVPLAEPQSNLVHALGGRDKLVKDMVKNSKNVR